VNAGQRRQFRRGHALVAVLLLLLVGGLLIVTASRTAGLSSGVAISQLQGLRAAYGVEGAALLSLREAAESADLDGDGVIGSISDDDNPATGPLLNGMALSATVEDQGGELLIAASVANTAAQRRLSARAARATAGSTFYASGLAAAGFTAPGSLNRINQVPWSAPPAYVGAVGDLQIAASGQPGWSGGPASNFGLRYTGRVTIPQAGRWTFSTTSDDGSRLWIDGRLVVNNDGTHSMRKRSGAINLEAGPHALEVKFFQRTGQQGLLLEWRGPGVPVDVAIPASALSYADNSAHPENLLENGGFEASFIDGTPTPDPGWDGSIASAVEISTSDVGPVHGGAVAARFNAAQNDGTNQELLQEVSGLNPGEPYTLFGYVQAGSITSDGLPDSGFVAALAHTPSDPPLAQKAQSSSTHGYWEPFAISATASASGDLWIRVRWNGVSAGTALLDDLVLVEGDVAGAQSLMIQTWESIEPAP
jgi:hypothetical protein